MTTTPGNASSNLPGKPPVVGLATWRAARGAAGPRRAHTREGDAIAAARGGGRWSSSTARSRSPALTGRSRSSTCSRVATSSWSTSTWCHGAPHQGQCEGCTTTAWHVKDAVYLNARGVSFAVLTSGPWDEVAPYVEFMGYTSLGIRCEAWRRRSAEVWGTSSVSCATAAACSSPTPRRAVATSRSTGPAGLLDMTPYGRGEAWEDNPEGWPVIGDVREGRRRGPPGLLVPRADADGVATWGPTGRPVPRWTRPGATPVETLGRQGHHH